LRLNRAIRISGYVIVPVATITIGKTSSNLFAVENELAIATLPEAEKKRKIK
jgi:hypothetical protein